MLNPGSAGSWKNDSPRIIREINKLVSSKALLLVHDSPEDVQLILHALRSVVSRVVLLDLNLPRVSGLDVLRELRANAETRLLPVAILSASVEQRDIRAAMQAGANTYIRKSLDYAKLQESMLLLARYWLDLNIQPYA